MSKSIVARINNYEVWVVRNEQMQQFAKGDYAFGIKPFGGTQWVDMSGFEFKSAAESERAGIQAARKFKPAVIQMRKSEMNVGKLVRQKMKELSADLSGEYIDNSGKHFAMKLSGEGYTIGYGGEAKREVEVTKPQAARLAGHSRKLDGGGEDKKELSLKRLSDNSIEYKGWIIYVEDTSGRKQDNTENDVKVWAKSDSSDWSDVAKRVNKANLPAAIAQAKKEIDGFLSKKKLTIGEQVEKKLAASGWQGSGDRFYKKGPGYVAQVNKEGDKWRWSVADAESNQHIGGASASSKDEAIQDAEIQIQGI